MLKKILLAAALVGIILYFFQSALESSSATQRLQTLQLRKEKNRNFRLSPNSPLSVDQRAQFDSLKYYAVNPDLVLTADIQRHANPATVLLQMSDTLTEKYLNWGQVSFTLNGQDQKLTLYTKASGQDSTLFVPFTDLTNGHETYGGGRYLDVAFPTPNATTIELDFNQAYNPYCAYNDSYSCPVPPAENRLQVAIAAGEKSFHE